jgi:hypothetical protein
MVKQSRAQQAGTNRSKPPCVRRRVLKGSPPYEGGVAAAWADGVVLSASVQTPPKGGTHNAGQSQSGRRTCPRSFEQIEHFENREHCGTAGTDRTTGTNRTARTSGTNRLFSMYSGTAGQKGLSQTDTTIKCPTKLSHFWDEWDKNGKSYAFRREPTRRMHDSRLRCSTGFTPKGVTLTFFLGHGTNLGRIGTRLPQLRHSANFLDI